MDLTTTPAAAILDMLEATVILIMMTAVLLLAFMVSSASCFKGKQILTNHTGTR